MNASVCNVDHMIAVHIRMCHFLQVPLGEKPHKNKIEGICQHLQIVVTLSVVTSFAEIRVPKYSPHGGQFETPCPNIARCASRT